MSLLKIIISSVFVNVFLTSHPEFQASNAFQSRVKASPINREDLVIFLDIFHVYRLHKIPAKFVKDYGGSESMEVLQNWNA